MSAPITPASADPRLVRAPLMLGLIALPIVFVWFLFLPGFSRSLRLVALAYAFMPVLVCAGFLIISIVVLGLVRLLGMAN